jgi:hypothetical protein
LALPPLTTYQVFAMAGESYMQMTNPTAIHPELNPYTGGNPQPPPPGTAHPQVHPGQGYYLMVSAALPQPQYPPQTAAPLHPPQTAESQAQYLTFAPAASYQGSPPIEKLPRRQPQEQYIQQQPMAQPAMSIRGSGGNRNLKNLPLGPNGRGWSNGLCRCYDEPLTCQCCFLLHFIIAVSHCSEFLFLHTGLLASVCPGIVYAQNKHRFDYLVTHGTPDPTKGGDMVSADCILMCYVSCLSCLLGVYVGCLSSVRFSVSRPKGSIGGDCICFRNFT